jgi:hypothetical protein
MLSGRGRDLLERERNLPLFILKGDDLSNAHEVDVLCENAAQARVIISTALTGCDLKAFNSFEPLITAWNVHSEPHRSARV